MEFDGTWEHTSGKGYCYGYIDGRYPVRIDRILHIELTGEPDLRCICALVRLFQSPEVEGRFPWDLWQAPNRTQPVQTVSKYLYNRAGHLGTSIWAYGELGLLLVIQVGRFSGALALFDVPMSYGRYWVAVALDSISPERDDRDGDE
jgi:hypothetical protein